MAYVSRSLRPSRRAAPPAAPPFTRRLSGRRPPRTPRTPRVSFHHYYHHRVTSVILHPSSLNTPRPSPPLPPPPPPHPPSSPHPRFIHYFNWHVDNFNFNFQFRRSPFRFRPHDTISGCRPSSTASEADYTSRNPSSRRSRAFIRILTGPAVAPSSFCTPTLCGCSVDITKTIFCMRVWFTLCNGTFTSVFVCSSNFRSFDSFRDCGLKVCLIACPSVNIPLCSCLIFIQFYLSNL